MFKFASAEKRIDIIAFPELYSIVYAVLRSVHNGTQESLIPNFILILIEFLPHLIHTSFDHLNSDLHKNTQKHISIHT